MRSDVKKSQRMGLQEQSMGGHDFKNNLIEADDMLSARYFLKKKFLTTLHLVFPRFQPL